VTTETNPKKKRVLSGMRPTGRLHIGHFFGALQNWVKLQNAVLPSGSAEAGKRPAVPGCRTPEAPPREYECFYFIADWHALTSDYADTSAIAQNTIEIATDYFASGLDPKKSVIFLQSLVPEHAELHLLLSMVTPLGWLERVPTYKEALENIKDKDLHTYGFLGYPVLQCGDIVMYGEPGASLIIPVGEDQVSHVEASREIVRRFNTLYGLQIDHVRWFEEDPSNLIFDAIRSGGSFLLEGLRRQALEDGIYNWMEKVGPRGQKYVRFSHVLVEPGYLLTPTPRIPGLDGRKMSKSYGNAITLSESDADIRAKTKVMMTDPARKRRTDPGNPDVCPVYDWHKLFSPPETQKWAAEGCRTASIGCIECKAAMADNLIKWITPIRERRLEYEKQPKRVLEILDDGSKKAREVAKATMSRVREAVFGWEKKRKEIQG
jgi:tryptophanyl-tRNA synthetase